MPIFKRILQLNATVGSCGALFTAYKYPELRKEPKQLVLAAVRGVRSVTACSLMAMDYVRAGDNITSETHYKAASRLYDCFCKNGGPYIKLGQLFGQLQSLVPDEYLEVFEPMCMKAPTTPFPDVKAIVELELDRPLSDVFSEFSEKPLASASLGQVHKAKLASTGETVVVKV